MRLVPIVVAALSSGCSIHHVFKLSDISALTIGKSLRSDVDGLLGRPRDTGYRLPHQLYQSTEMIASPPWPFSLVTWPVYWAGSREQYTVTARFTEEGVLTDMSLLIDGNSDAFILLFIHPHLLAPKLNRSSIEELRALEKKGVKVAVEAYFEKLSIDEYETSFNAFVK